MRRLALLFVSLALALGTFAWVSPAPVVFAQDLDAEEWAFIDLLNAYRGSLGIGPVTLNSELSAAADYHSVDMATNNYFDHYLYDGTDAGTNIQNFGYSGFPYSENIAAGMATAHRTTSHRTTTGEPAAGVAAAGQGRSPRATTGRMVETSDRRDLGQHHRRHPERDHHGDPERRRLHREHHQDRVR